MLVLGVILVIVGFLVPRAPRIVRTIGVAFIVIGLTLLLGLSDYWVGVIAITAAILVVMDAIEARRGQR